jgi:chemotaxis protein histidine kinase CheA
VEELVESIQTTGFWENIVGREVDGKLQVAYGHHRLEALKKVYPMTQEFDWRVRKLSDGTMVQMMARENSEAYKQNADVLLESIRAAVQALAKGQITIGKESGQIEATNGNTSKNQLRYAPSFIQGNVPAAATAAHTYSAETLGKFLGIPTLGGSSRCMIALNALELIETDYLPEHLTRGITIAQLKELVDDRIAERKHAREKAVEDAKRKAEETKRATEEKARQAERAIAEAKRKAAQAEADKAEREAQARRDAARKAEQKAADEKVAARKSKEVVDQKQAEKAKAEAARAKQAEAEAEKVAKDKQKAADKAKKELEDKAEQEKADKAKREAKLKAEREAEAREEEEFVIQQRERKATEKATIAFMFDMVSSGRKALAQKHHPDHGGKTSDMVLINAAYNRLNTILKENTQ